MFKWLLLFVALLTPAMADCFPPSEIANVTPVGWTVTMQTPSPAYDGQSSFKYYPLTIASPTYEDGDAHSTWTGGDNYHHFWMDRWNGGQNKRTNPINPQVVVNGKPCGIEFTSLNGSIESFASKFDYDIGRGPTLEQKPSWGYVDALTYLGDNGLIGMTHAEFVANAAALCTGYDALRDWWKATNVVIWPDIRLADTPRAAGEKIDFERQDDPPVATMSGLIDWAVTNIHKVKDVNGDLRNFKLRIYTNPLNAAFFFHNGLDPVHACNAVDACNIFTFSEYGPALTQMTEQLAILATVPPEKIFWLIDSKETPDDIAPARALAISSGLSGVEFFTNGSTVCSPDWNATVSAALGLQ